MKTDINRKNLRLLLKIRRKLDDEIRALLLVKDFLSSRDLYACKNCGEYTNGDFWCIRCGEVLCEGCSNHVHCNECEDREREKILERQEYDGDTIG